MTPQEGDQRAVAQAGHGRDVDAVEQLFRFVSVEHGGLAFLDDVFRAAHGRMPRQVRNPCSGCGRLAITALIRPSVFGPILPAQRRNRSGVHSA